MYVRGGNGDKVGVEVSKLGHSQTLFPGVFLKARESNESLYVPKELSFSIIQKAQDFYVYSFVTTVGSESHEDHAFDEGIMQDTWERGHAETLAAIAFCSNERL